MGKNEERLVKYERWQGLLYDAWSELKELLETEVRDWQVFSKAVQETFNKRQAEFNENMKKRQALLLRVEQKKFNLEALTHSKRLPFPAEVAPPDELLRLTKAEVAALSGVAAMRAADGDTAVEDLMASAKEVAETTPVPPVAVAPTVSEVDPPDPDDEA